MLCIALLCMPMISFSVPNMNLLKFSSSCPDAGSCSAHADPEVTDKVYFDLTVGGKPAGMGTLLTLEEGTQLFIESWCHSSVLHCRTCFLLIRILHYNLLIHAISDGVCMQGGLSSGSLEKMCQRL